LAQVNYALVLGPLLSMAAGALVVLIIDLLLPARQGRIWWYLASLAAVLLGLYYTLAAWGSPAASIYNGAFISDRFTLTYNLIILGATLFTVLLSVRRTEEDVSGYLALVLWAAMGMMVLAGAGNLMAIFLGLELLSLGLYVVVGFRPQLTRAREAAFKYFVLGSVASAFLIFGFALLYGFSGSTDLIGIGNALSKGGPDVFFKAGIAMALVGFGFKIALVPFHVWAPDAYEGAPSAITAFMSVGTKAGAFAALTRFLVSVFGNYGGAVPYLTPLLVLAALSMLVGSLGALGQTNLKRLLAYSGIANAGYLFLALPGLRADGISAGAFYLLTYLFTNMGAFAVIAWMGAENGEGGELEQYAGLFSRKPWLAWLFTLFLFSLTGIPPAAGFMGKLLLLRAAMAGGNWLLLGMLIVTTGISAFAYLRVVKVMWGQPAIAGGGAVVAAPAAGVESAFSPGLVRGAIGVALLLAVIGTLQLGILPGTAGSLLQGLLR